MKKIIFLFFISSLLTEMNAQTRKALWAWDTYNVVGNSTQENILINECLSTGISDIYLYIAGSLLKTSSGKSKARAFIAKASCNNIRIWGMDGWRGYFSDLCGPSDFYDNIQLVIDYNAESAANERFFGFHGDNEFHAYEDESGCGLPDVFHRGKSDAALSTVSGSGIWQNTQKKDRDSLMTDFVRQTDEAASMCHNAGMEYGIAVMASITGTTWTNATVGNQNTPLYAYYKGVNKELFKHLMDYVDEYVIMSYHTNVQGKVVYMCEDELAYADGLSALDRPRVLSGLETYCDVGEYVSYCDTPSENTKTHVKNNEIPAHISLLGAHDSYSGVAIHDWEGWKGLAPVSSNSSTPPGNGCTTTGLFQSEESRLEIYPNPADAFVTVNIENFPGNVSVELINQLGVSKFRAEEISQGEYKIELSHLEKGVYFLVLSDEQKKEWVKVVKY